MSAIARKSGATGSFRPILTLIQQAAAQARQAWLRVPYALAELYGVAVHPLDGLAAAGCPTASLPLYSMQRPEAWSAASASSNH